MKSLLDEISEIENGRFSAIIKACTGTCEECRKCYYFNPAITDPMQGYRCRCMPFCPAATLSNEVKAYILDRIILPTDGR